MDLISATEAEGWDRDGYIVLRGAIPSERVRLVESHLDRLEEETTDWIRRQNEDGRRFEIRRDPQSGTSFDARVDEITFTIHPAARVSELAAFCRQPVFRQLAHDLIGDDVRLLWDQAVYKKPDTPASFPWHQDNGYSFALPQQYVTCWIPLTDADTSNGCLWVLPGLHRLGTLHHELTDTGFRCLGASEAHNAIPIEAEVGDIVVLSSLAPHATGPNSTNQTRKAYVVQLAADGTVMYTDGPSADGAQPAPVRANDPVRQFVVLGCE